MTVSLEQKHKNQLPLGDLLLLKVSKCPSCSKAVGDSCRSLQCENFKNWYHSKCQKIKDADYDIIGNYDSLHWFCSTCNQAVSSILKLLTNIKGMQDKLKDQIESTIKRVQEVERALENLQNKALMKDDSEYNQNVHKLTQVEKSIKDLESKVIHKDDETYASNIEKLIDAKIDSRLSDKSKQSAMFSEVVAKQVDEKFESVTGEVAQVQQRIKEARDIAEEEKDREGRGNNIIIYRIPECSSNLKEECKKHDQDFVLKMVKDVLEVNMELNDIKAMFRMGKRDANNIRPLMIQLREKSVKNEIMESLFRLRSADVQYRSLSIVHDMSPKERAVCKQLVGEAKTKQSAETGNFIWRVRGLPGQLKVVRIIKKQI